MKKRSMCVFNAFIHSFILFLHKCRGSASGINHTICPLPILHTSRRFKRDINRMSCQKLNTLTRFLRCRVYCHGLRVKSEKLYKTLHLKGFTNPEKLACKTDILVGWKARCFLFLY